MVRKFTKSKAIFPTDDSIRKIIFMSVKEISKKWTMPVRDWGLAYSQLAIFFEDRFAAWRLLRTLSSNSWGLSAWKIPVKRKAATMRCSSPYIFTACVGSLLSVALFGCNFSMVKIFVGNSFTQFIFHAHFIPNIKQPLMRIVPIFWSSVLIRLSLIRSGYVILHIFVPQADFTIFA